MSRIKTDQQLRNLKRRFLIRIKIAEIDLLFHFQYSATAPAAWSRTMYKC